MQKTRIFVVLATIFIIASICLLSVFVIQPNTEHPSQLVGIAVCCVCFGMLLFIGAYRASDNYTKLTHENESEKSTGIYSKVASNYRDYVPSNPSGIGCVATSPLANYANQERECVVVLQYPQVCTYGSVPPSFTHTP